MERGIDANLHVVDFLINYSYVTRGRTLNFFSLHLVYDLLTYRYSLNKGKHSNFESTKIKLVNADYYPMINFYRLSTRGSLLNYIHKPTSNIETLL